MDPEDPSTTDAPSDAGVALAVDRLGEPSATFAVNPVVFWGKLAIGLLLVLYGVVATVLRFTFGGVKGLGHWEFHLLFWPMILGVMLLVHLVRNRGVKVLLFPTGLLHLRPGLVESFPWDEIVQVHLKAGAGAAVVLRDDAGAIVSAWIAVPTTVVQVWNSWVRVTRADGLSAKVTTVLAGFPDLAREVQAETFTRLWPAYRDALAAGESVQIGPLFATRGELRMGKKTIAWTDVKKMTPSQKMLSIERKGGWVPWLAVPLDQVPNPHLLFAVANLATGGKIGAAS